METAQARGGQRGLDPRVSRAYYYYIALSRVVDSHVFSPYTQVFHAEIIRQKES